MQKTSQKISETGFGKYYSYSNKSKTQRIAIGISSIPISGLGQVINGETSKGVAFFLATLLNTACYFARNRRNKIAHLIMALGLKAWSAIDAYKRS